MYDFKTLLDRKGTDCIKWDAMEMAFGREDLMPFWVADGDFPVLPEIRQELEKRCAPGQTFGYTQAGERFIQAVIRWNRERHNLAVRPEEILLVPGVVTGLSVVTLALTGEKEPVLITPPVYTPFFNVVKNLGRTLVEAPLRTENGRYVFDFEEMEAKMAAGVKMFILCSPQNPVGRVWEESELIRVAELCRRYKVQLVSDEIHYDIVAPGKKHICIPQVEQDAVMLTAASKTFNIAGLKTSYMIIRNPELRKKVAGWLHCLELECNLFGLLATAAAYENGAAWADEMNLVIQDNAEMAVSFFAENLPQVKAYVPESTYLMWLDFSGFGLDEKEIQKKLVEQAGVALNPGRDYGKGYEGFLRMNIAVPKEYLRRGLEKIVEAFR